MTRHSGAALLLALLTGVSAGAQETQYPKREYRTGVSLFSAGRGKERVTAKGYLVSTNFNFGRNFGFAVDHAMDFRTAKKVRNWFSLSEPGTSVQESSGEASQVQQVWQLLGGPRVNGRRGSVTAFYHTQIGPMGILTNGPFQGTGFALDVGGGSTAAQSS